MAAPMGVVPRPVECVEGQGRFTFSPDTVFWVRANDDRAVKVGQFLTKTLTTVMGEALQCKALSATAEVSTEGNVVLLRIDSSTQDIPREGYRLSVVPHYIQIEASSPAGLYYGVQTLLQLLPPQVYASNPRAGVDWSAAAVTISDAPRFGWRGLHLDVCRHFMPVPFIKKYIDLLAMHKMNLFHWHLTEDQGWRLEIKKYPRLTEIGSVRAESPRHGNRKQGDGKQYGPYFSPV